MASEHEELVAQWALPELVEAAARSGRQSIALAAAFALAKFDVRGLIVVRPVLLAEDPNV